MVSGFDFVLVGLAAIAAGAVNALAGGGTLITFPMLTAVGLPAVAANVTNTMALCPGYLGATFAQRGDLRGQRARLLVVLPASVLGGLAGGVLLLNTGERTFRDLVPYLILLASLLLAAQETLRDWLLRRPAAARAGRWAAVPVGLAGIYGGYFGAGLSVIVLAVLALMIEESLTRLNALKQAVAFSVNIAAAVLFTFSDQVNWPAAGVMAAGALAGGSLGGRLAGRIRPETLRTIVVTVGLVVAAVYFLRG